MGHIFHIYMLVCYVWDYNLNVIANVLQWPQTVKLSRLMLTGITKFLKAAWCFFEIRSTSDLTFTRNNCSLKKKTTFNQQQQPESEM